VVAFDVYDVVAPFLEYNVDISFKLNSLQLIAYASLPSYVTNRLNTHGSRTSDHHNETLTIYVLPFLGNGRSYLKQLRYKFMSQFLWLEVKGANIKRWEIGKRLATDWPLLII